MKMLRCCWTFVSVVSLLDHVRHRHLGVLLEHAGHQAVAADVVDALGDRKRRVRTAVLDRWVREPLIDPTWLMSLVQAAFSWRDGASRTTEKLCPSGGSTTILNSRWLKPWPAALSANSFCEILNFMIKLAFLITML